MTAVTPPRIVLLTSGYVNGRNLSRALHELSIPFDIVTVAFDPPRRRGAPLARHVTRVATAHVKAIGPLRRLAQRRLPRFPFSPRYAGFCNGQTVRRVLERLKPDYIVMMGGGILSPEIIRSARRGVLNSHPGLLPWVRGVDVVPTAILRGVPIGVTCHFIDDGIDTGDVIVRYLLPTSPGETMPVLLDRANQLECAAMLNLVIRIAAGETIPRYPQSDRHPYCRSLSASDRAKADQLVVAGRAAELREAWQPLVIDGTFADAAPVLDQYETVLRASNRGSL